MFSSSRPNLYESDEGFSVEVLGRTGLLYKEGSKSMFIDSEILMGPSGLAVLKDSITAWKAPDEHETIDADKRAKIVDNIRRAFKWQGFDVEIVEQHTSYNSEQ